MIHIMMYFNIHHVYLHFKEGAHSRHVTSSKLPETVIYPTTMYRIVYTVFHLWSCDILISECSFTSLC